MEISINKSYPLSFGQHFLTHLWLPSNAQWEWWVYGIAYFLFRFVIYSTRSLGLAVLVRYGAPFLVVIFIKLLIALMSVPRNDVHISISDSGLRFDGLYKKPETLPWNKIVHWQIKHNWVLINGVKSKNYAFPLSLLEEDAFHEVENRLYNQCIQLDLETASEQRSSETMTLVYRSFAYGSPLFIRLALVILIFVEGIIAFASLNALTYATVLLFIIMGITGVLLVINILVFPSFKVKDDKVFIHHGKTHSMVAEKPPILVRLRQQRLSVAHWFLPCQTAPMFTGLIGLLYFGTWCRGYWVSEKLDGLEILISLFQNHHP